MKLFQLYSFGALLIVVHYGTISTLFLCSPDGKNTLPSQSLFFVCVLLFD